MQNNKLQTLRNPILARIRLISISDDDEIGFWLTKSTNDQEISHSVAVTVFWNIKVPRRPHAQHKHFSCVVVVEQDVYYENKYYFPYDNFNNYLIVP